MHVQLIWNNIKISSQCLCQHHLYIDSSSVLVSTSSWGKLLANENRESETKTKKLQTIKWKHWAHRARGKPQSQEIIVCRFVILHIHIVISFIVKCKGINYINFKILVSCDVAPSVVTDGNSKYVLITQIPEDH